MVDSAAQTQGMRHHTWRWTRPAQRAALHPTTGVGMTEDEVQDHYINQVAFSGAEDPSWRNYAKATRTRKIPDIIGHFGLGFYSVFMIADQGDHRHALLPRGREPRFAGRARTAWPSTMTEGTRTARGTTITLHVSEAEKRVPRGLARARGARPLLLVHVRADLPGRNQGRKRPR